MRKLNNTETELKKALLMKKACSIYILFLLDGMHVIIQMSIKIYLFIHIH